MRTLWLFLGAVVVGGLILAGSVASASSVRVRARAAGGDPAADCQPFGGRPCLLPFPNNLYTRADRSSQTGLRLNLPAGAMPVNASGQRESVAPFDRADGFSPGSAAILHVPGLDTAQAFARTGRGRCPRHGQLAAQEPADRGCRRADGAPSADLVRARRERHDPADHEPADPRRHGIRRRPHVHCRAAQPARRCRACDPGPQVVRTAARQEAPAGQRALAADTIRTDLRRAGEGRRPAGESVRGVGFHRGLASEPDGSAALDPQQRVRAARRQEARRRQSDGPRAEVHDHSDARRSRPS